MALLMLILPIITAGLFWTTQNKKYIHLMNGIGASLILFSALFTVNSVMDQKVLTYNFLNKIIYLDAFSALNIFMISLISFFACLYSIGYMNEEYKRKTVSLRKVKIYYSLLFVFIFTMLLTVSTQNMGLIWIAIEATTLASAFLVGLHNNKNSIEAAWKYIMICSVGIAFAMLGVVLLYYSAIHSLGASPQGLNWEYLYLHAGELKGGILKLSFIFILLGFGTKAGLAPMHTWLPDAHSQAPSPVSALLSGVLLNTAMYGILRILSIVNKNQMSNLYTSRLMIVFGILSIGTAAIFILVQHDFKRTLAYSSIEHMGIISFAVGIGTPLSVFGALYHMLNHAFTKSMLFMAAGNVYLKYDTKRMNKVRGVIKVMPVTGVVFVLGILAITGVPPFSIFSSELFILIEGFSKGYAFITGLILLFLVLTFAGFIAGLFKMFFGKPLHKELEPRELNRIGTVLLVVLIGVVATTGLFLPKPIKELIESASQLIYLKR